MKLREYAISIPVNCSINMIVTASSEASALKIAEKCIDDGKMRDGSELPTEEYFEMSSKYEWSVEEV